MLKQISTLALGGIAAVALATTGANANLVTNGDFSSYVGPAVGGQVDFNETLNGWTLETTSGGTGASGSNSYTFVEGSATDATTGVTGNDGLVALKGGAGGVTAPSGTGTFLAMDPAYPVNQTDPSAFIAITQNVTGLSVGQQYTLSFAYGASQQTNHNGSITAGWTVNMGGSQIATVSKAGGSSTDTTGGFSGWFTDSITFTATSTSEVLSFIGQSTQSESLPPFALLTDVSITPNTSTVPEPSTVSMLGMVLIGLGGLIYRRRNKTA
ncbi:MAG TPA: PEP-CTERM sorting domain-containing protein [Rhizomicrobium sp.]|nr:PEP-CTERM sorting domain-containing protein [Rhizomicrobium sp.]